MKVFHYTSIENLALILDSGKIRFSRLDTVDDLNETKGLPESIRNEIYISCWTKDDKENAILWDMYTRNKGVRIELPIEFYNDFKAQNNFPVGAGSFFEAYKMPMTSEEMTAGSCVFTVTPSPDGNFYTEVEYCENAELMKVQKFPWNGNSQVSDSSHNLVKFKDKQWEFQKEFRYYLLGKSSENAVLPKFKDMQIRKDVLDNVVVRLHPNADTSSNLIVKALLAKYTNNGILEESMLNGVYNPKKH